MSAGASGDGLARISRDQSIHLVIDDPSDPQCWRDLSRKALSAGIAPENLVWSEGDGDQLELEMAAGADLAANEREAVGLSIPKSLLRLLETALLHSDPARYDLAYRIVWRMQGRRDFVRNPSDPDMVQLQKLAKSVRRDIHKMHAFVRFREVEASRDREHFVAWFEPDHHIVRVTGPFFARRFAGMDWAIFTPRQSVRWDGEKLTYGGGCARSDIDARDDTDAEWRAYYTAIFNPARLKVKAMLSEMPRKYWKNLPEADLIPSLIRDSANRTERMIATGGDKERPAMEPTTPHRMTFSSLSELYDAMRSSPDCPREGFSEWLVEGEGPSDARIMLIGEQPGDVEDREGRPFVGPAGELLDKALNEAGLARSELFVTNAVKRFKFQQRGKRRLHQTPTAGEIKHYRWWLMEEIRLVSPAIVVALGASALRAVLGKPQPVNRVRGEIISLDVGPKMLATVHPSFLLRLPDPKAREIEYGKFRRDLALAADV